MKRQPYWIGLCVLLAALLVWLAFFWEPEGMTGEGNAAGIPPPSQTVLLQDKPAGGDFSLDTPAGKRWLHDYRGKVVVIFFGYTFCPDICPTSLSSIGQAFAKLPADDQAKVQGIFISVDPDRDTQEVLNTYAPFFHPNIVGMTGTDEQIAEVARQYGVVYTKQTSGDGRPYSVDHTASVFIVAPDGTLANILPHGFSVQQLTKAIQQQLGSAKKK